MNKRAEGQTDYFIGLALFIFAWVYYFGEVISDWGYTAVNSNGLVGIEALLYSNLNLILFFMVIITTIMVVRYSN